MSNKPLIALSALLSLVSCSSDFIKNGRVAASGTIEATEVNVSSKTGGQINRMVPREGDRVETNDTLAVIDHSTLDLQLRQARAGLELARIQVESDRRDYQRINELFQKGSTTQKQADDAETKLKVSQAKAEQALASLEIIRKNISDSYLMAPVGGLITNANFERGETVGPGSVLFTISRLDTVEITVYVSEAELGYVKLGQPAEISTDSYRGKGYPGKVTYISSQAEFTPKNIQTKQDRVKQVFGVKIELPNPDMELKPGLPADAAIIINK